MKRATGPSVTRVLHVGIVACMLAMALLPLIGTGTVSAAEDGDPILLQQADNPPIELVNTDQFDLNDPEADPEDPGPVDAQSTPTGEDDDDDYVDPGYEGYVGAIEIWKMACPEGFEDANQFDLNANCEPMGGVDFQFDDSYGGQTDLQSDASGHVYLNNIPVGDTSVTEQVPDGYGTARVFCMNIDEQTGMQEMELDGATIWLQLPAETFSCGWYNFPYGGGDTGDSGDNAVVIYKYSCLEGYDVYNFDPDGVASVCQETQNGVTFNLTDGGPTNLSGQSGDNGDGELDFTGLGAGEYFISEEIPAGYGTPKVYCGIAPTGEDAPVEPDLMDVSDSGEIFSVLATSETLWCYWFNVPDGGATDQGTGAEVTVHKQVCPVDYDASNADYDTLKNDCGTPQEGIDFSFSNEDPQSQVTQQSGQTDVDGLVFASIDNPGELTISESLGAGYGEPIVYCYNPYLDVPGASGSPEQVSNGSVVLSLSEGQTVYCDWFNMPTDDNGIIIYKFVCPVGFDAYNSDPDGLSANCGDYLNDVTFNANDGGPTNLSGKTGDAGDGKVVFDGLDAGEYFISEEIPAGYGKPVVYCGLVGAADGAPADYSGMDVSESGEIFSVLATDDYLWCYWFNVPTDDLTVTIDKYECPVGFDAYNASSEDLEVYCSGNPMDGVDFTLSYPIDTKLHGTTGDAGPGKVVWNDVGQVPMWITEDVPAGYGEPVVYCFLDQKSWSPNGPQIDVEDGVIQIDPTGHHDLHCLWFNVPTDQTVKITIVKHTCPEGYDIYAPGADPEYDCPDLTNGIGFELDGKGEHEQGVTGDNGPGTVTFSDLAWHPWVVTEQVPAGIEYVFVLSCEGSSTQQIQGYPLSFGSELGIDVGPGDHVICHWYNVPEEQGGKITIEKEYCETKTFVSADDCQIYEGGARFSLSVWNGSTWVEVADGKTDGSGYLSWDGLQGGTYQIDEIGATWCYAVADNTDADGYLVVTPGEETHVTVYNCGVKTKPRKPGKFPNTGVAPGEATAPSGQNAPVSPKTDENLFDPTKWMGVFDSRLIAPFLDGTKPVELRIESVGIDAQTETLEIVDGGLQDPTTADKVAWYKDTAKLGEDGNVVMAGHLNYWGVPKGVFFRLADVKKGDIIEVTGENGAVYRYKVQWVKQIDVDGADVAKLVGETKKPSLTLITCGGEWDGSIQEYNKRTVLRATLITE